MIMSKGKPITSRTPRQMPYWKGYTIPLVIFLRTFKIQDMVLDNKILWHGILASIMFTLRVTIHTTTQYTPAQLFFGCDFFLNQRHDKDWEAINTRKQAPINKSNAHKNKINKKHM